MGVQCYRNDSDRSFNPKFVAIHTTNEIQNEPAPIREGCPSWVVVDEPQLNWINSWFHLDDPFLRTRSYTKIDGK